MKGEEWNEKGKMKWKGKAVMKEEGDGVCKTSQMLKLLLKVWRQKIEMG